jgi:predicted RNA-binding Zn-ribbon protein involved in translation (DUF1610 family)
MNGKLTIIRNIRGSKSDIAECMDCKTEFYIDKARVKSYDVIKCNGAIIDKCSWCRPDSQKWQNGRGI